MDWYRRYRAQGGYPQTPGAELIDAVLPALEKGAPIAAELDAMAADTDAPSWLRHLARALAHLARGDSAAARAALPDLNYANAVELERILDGPRS